MEKEFVLMNIIFKGTTTAIEQALSLPGIPYYERVENVSHEANLELDDISKVYLIFPEFPFDEYLPLSQLPFTAVPDVKFIALAHGGEPGKSEGSFCIFKDFCETKPSVCRKFTIATPIMDEFFGDEEWENKLMHSFLYHSWSYPFNSIDDNRIAYAFNKKKDLELIARWEDDLLWLDLL